MGRGGDKIAPNGGGDSSSSQQQGATEILIDGKLFDVKDFNHPGGTILKFYSGNGIDATEAFNNFHVRSKKARAVMTGLPNRAADEKLVAEKLKGQSALMKDFAELTAQLTKEGYFKPDLAHVSYRVSEIVLMHAIGFGLLFNGYMWPGIIVLGIVSGRCGWLMHEGGHYSLTGSSLLPMLVFSVVIFVRCFTVFVVYLTSLLLYFHPFILCR